MSILQTTRGIVTPFVFASRGTIRSGILVLAISILGTPAAFADAIFESVELVLMRSVDPDALSGPTPTFTESIMLPGFNSGLGVLTGIRYSHFLRLDVGLIAEFEATTLNATGSVAGVSGSATLSSLAFNRSMGGVGEQGVCLADTNPATSIPSRCMNILDRFLFFDDNQDIFPSFFPTFQDGMLVTVSSTLDWFVDPGALTASWSGESTATARVGVRYTYDPFPTPPTSVPEPTAGVLLLSGIAVLFSVRRRIQKNE